MRRVLMIVAGIFLLLAPAVSAEVQDIVTITSDDIILNEPQFTDYVNKKLPFLSNKLINLEKEQPYKHLNVDFKDFEQFWKTVNNYYFLVKTFDNDVSDWEEEAKNVREEIFNVDSISSSAGIKYIFKYKFLRKNIKYSQKNLEILQVDFDILFKQLGTSKMKAPSGKVKDLRSYAAFMVNNFQLLKAKKISFDDFESKISDKAKKVENAKHLYEQFLQTAIELTGSFHLRSEMKERTDSAVLLAEDFLSYELYVAGNKKVTVSRLLNTAAFVIVLILIYFVLKLLFRVTFREKSVSYAINTLTKYGFIFAVIVISLDGFGVEMQNLTLLVSALSVGIGFGLSNIVSNFVSGILLLLERTIKIGDKIILQNGTTATVEVIGLRKSVLTTVDFVNITIPNTDLVSKEVVNLTHGDNPRSRHHLKFTVNPAIDLKKMEKVALKSIADTFGGKKKTVYEPPVLLISNLNAAEVECEILVWIDNLHNPIPYGLFKKHLMHDFLENGLDIFTAPVQLVEMVDKGSKLSTKEAHKR